MRIVAVRKACLVLYVLVVFFFVAVDKTRYSPIYFLCFCLPVCDTVYRTRLVYPPLNPRGDRDNVYFRRGCVVHVHKRSGGEKWELNSN